MNELLPSMSKEWFLYQKNVSETLVRVNAEKVVQAFWELYHTICRDQQIFVIGNGGSAAIAEHWAVDFFKGIRTGSDLYWPVVHALTTNSGRITAIANDIGYEKIFSYQLETLQRKGDILIAISSSGNSPNIKDAIETFRYVGGKVIGLSGFEEDNYVNNNTDVAIHVPFKNYGVVEDIHSMIMHSLSQALRKRFANPDQEIKNFTF